MLKRCYQKDVYMLKGRYGLYIVSIDNYSRDIYGNAKYEAIITNISEPEKKYSSGVKYSDGDPVYCYNAVYRFGTHYTGTAKEADFILSRYEDDLDKMNKGE